MTTRSAVRQAPPLPLQLHLLEYNDDTGVLDKTAFQHPAGEQWVTPGRWAEGGGVAWYIGGQRVAGWPGRWAEGGGVAW